ncbi:dynactin subunit [Anaeramoeba flamelloides]|uniref:Dynactin subunit n=1 Tax=Anaeramoeba flamelloides TaxID=1746091 RepID=A0AAV7YHH4_9EUKA|nr:dynactin subunit [Anaeramoeba flamelloides]
METFSTDPKEIPIIKYHDGSKFQFESNNYTNNRQVSEESISVEKSLSQFQNKEVEFDRVLFQQRLDHFKNERKENLKQKAHSTQINEKKNTVPQKETSIQQYKRLNLEISQFISDLQSVINEPNVIDSEISTQELLKMTQGLQSKLNETKLPFLVGDENETKNEQEKEKEDLQKKFQKEKEILNNLGETSTKEINTTQEKKKSSSKKINYELNVSALSEDIKDNEKQKKENNDEILKLDLQISKLEKITGINEIQGNISFLDCKTHIKFIKEKLKKLTNEEMESLIQKIEFVSSQLKVLEDQLKTISISKISNQNISKIYQMMENWEIIIPTLPSLLNRLKLLEIAQNEKKSIIGRIEQLSNSQEIIQKTLLQQSPIVQEINDQLLSNFKYIRDNIEQLEQQFKSFKK